MTNVQLAERLRHHVGAGASTTLESLTQIVSEAQALVEAFAGKHRENIPGPVWERAVLECASELYAKQNAIGGIVSDFSDGPTVRLARDPMVAARPLLAPYVPLGFG